MTAACASHDPDWWFRPDSGEESPGNRLAERICGRCVIADECRARAESRGETDGLYGGKWFTEPEFVLLDVMPPLPHSYESGCKCAGCLADHAARVKAHRAKPAATSPDTMNSADQLILFATGA